MLHLKRGGSNKSPAMPLWCGTMARAPAPPRNTSLVTVRGAFAGPNGRRCVQVPCIQAHGTICAKGPEIQNFRAALPGWQAEQRSMHCLNR
eukprot:364845-Chlamydomonas_euryale.AAC.2